MSTVWSKYGKDGVQSRLTPMGNLTIEDRNGTPLVTIHFAAFGVPHEAKKDALFARIGVDVLDGVMEQIQLKLCDSFDREVFGALWSHSEADSQDKAFLNVDTESTAGKALANLRKAEWHARRPDPATRSPGRNRRLSR